MWYSRRPRRAAVQALFDLVVIAWCVTWAFVGRAVRDLVTSLAAPVRSLADAGSSYDSSVRAAGEDLTRVPVVGEQLRGAFGTLAGPGAQAAEAGTRMAGTIERVGVVVGLAVTVSAALALVVPWLALRLAFVRRMAQVRELARQGQVELLALRALTHQSLERLRTAGDDPAAAWRRGDPGATRALAALELRDVGVSALARHDDRA